MLARELGMTVRELLMRMDSREFSEWIAYMGLDAGPAAPAGQSGREIETRVRAAQAQVEGR